MLNPVGRWCRGRVASVVHPSPDAVVLRLEVSDRLPHLPGQHYVIRLRAEDGYTASRSYSLASAPDDELLEFYVERLADGEVSPYLAEAVEVGDALELRGPIGGWFVWDGRTPAVGIGGGTGVVPLVSMVRQARALDSERMFHLAVGARRLTDLPYADELTAYRATIALSRERSLSGRPAGRLGAAELGPYVDPDATYFVCGSAGFAESARELLMSLGVRPGAVRVERFGPSGT